MALTRLDSLLNAYFDGTLSPEDRHELEQRLLSSVENQEKFWEWASWDAILGEWGEELGSWKEMPCRPPRRVAPDTKRSRMLNSSLLTSWSFGLAGFVFVALVLCLNLGDPGVKPSAALLVSTVNARWSDDTPALSVTAGNDPAGRDLSLIEGTAEFQTLHGASVLMEGPASIRFEGPTSLFVRSGKVVCRCPTPASRLTVNTSQTSVEDLGTDFTVEAREDQSTRVAVLSGEVKVGGGKGGTVLRKGEAAEVRTLGVTMLNPEEVQQMLSSFDQSVGVPDDKDNWLKNGTFDTPTPGSKDWLFSSKGVRIENGVLLVSARKQFSWPHARQKIFGEGLSGRTFVASVRTLEHTEDPLRAGQYAVLKLNFIDKYNKAFAYAAKAFLFSGETINADKSAQLAAIAPPGTKGVSFELLLGVQRDRSGTVAFDDAVLRVGEPPARNAAP
ncbi:FecR domain-containing protein [Verrucomicrobium spinosum]|uniref:FecR domain-containing protein n=1 Tax=Verrucomicrobium spinosum TaxID=2736 RepID=UPI0001745134|nr:FecR domain-containing protein [Verrucomicrobium spinosum]